jgi:hypothetical protein
MADNDFNKGAYANAAAMRRRYALHLLQQASDASPVKHPLQALARALQGGIGGYYLRQLQNEELGPTRARLPMQAGYGGAPAAGDTDVAARQAAPLSLASSALSPTANTAEPFLALRQNPQLPIDLESQHNPDRIRRFFGGE